MAALRAAPPDLKNMSKILFIEDDQDQIFLYQTKFELEGFEFIAARHGNEGINLAIEKQPDLILLDLVLIKEDGMEVLKKLKEDKKTSNIPVIILTNLAKKDLAQKGKDLGAVDFVVKSQTVPSDVVRIVKGVLKIN